LTDCELRFVGKIGKDGTKHYPTINNLMGRKKAVPVLEQLLGAKRPLVPFYLQRPLLLIHSVLFVVHSVFQTFTILLNKLHAVNESQVQVS
jgi:hypothetical protein